MAIKLLQEEEEKAKNKDKLLSSMMSLTIDQKPEILWSQKLKEEIDRVEKRAQISVSDYMGFGDIAPGAIKYLRYPSVI